MSGRIAPPRPDAAMTTLHPSIDAIRTARLVLRKGDDARDFIPARANESAGTNVAAITLDGAAH
jgi:hypothetical protein